MKTVRTELEKVALACRIVLMKAACHGREDVAALVIIQHSVLRRLDQLRTLAVIGLCLMAYIAVRVS